MNKRRDFDLIAIGTGPAAGTVAKKAADSKKKVAVVEAREYGGTCALRGCNPKKVYTNAGNLIDRVRGAEGKLVDFKHVTIDWSRLLGFKQEFTRAVLESSESSFQEVGIETFHGVATFEDQNTIRVASQLLTADRIFIGVGACPRPLDFEGGDLAILSDQFLELSELPDRIAFVGGGYVSMEFACVAARHCGQVTILQSGDRVLSQFDSDLVKQLVDYSASSGVAVETNSTVKRIERITDDKFAVHYGEAASYSIEADLVVHGAGRVPNIRQLNLKQGNVASTDSGIEVDEFMRSVSNASVFAAGDCIATTQPMLTPSANEQARCVVKNLFADRPEERPEYGVVPQVAFTVPPIASIGMSHEEAERSSLDIDIRHGDMSSWGSVRKSGQRCGGFKIIVDKASDLIVGAHLLGPGADETINLVALAMKFGLTATDVKSTLFAFPTYGSDLRRML